METIYKTTQIANEIGIHPNTVRLYEELELIPKPQRLANGYRVFTDFHLDQFRLARTAFQVEVLQNGLRKKMVNIIKTSARGEFDEALSLTRDYLEQIQKEQRYAEEAIEIAGKLIAEEVEKEKQLFLTRQQAADYLQVTIDTLRNWELNGLLCVKRSRNGYRIYSESDIRRLKMIRSLRCANYSLSAILRMINAISGNPEADIRKVIDTPEESEDIISACDKLLTSLKNAELNACSIQMQLKLMRKKYHNPTV